jgi:dTDP-glucose 4,6-dehydratase
MRKIVITGGAGFIGSHIVEHLAASLEDTRIVVLDKMTYAADFRNLEGLLHAGAIDLVVGDVCDYNLCRKLLDGADLLIHAAAESHVDNSFHSSLLFTQTNVLGTHTVMEAAREAELPKIIHISTDEVYGEIISGAADESAHLNPTNPYSASKAAADMIINGYKHSFNLPVIVVRANNVFGARQYPEKLIPRCCLSVIRGSKIPIHGNGQNLRHYLSAKDLAEAIALVMTDGELHATYNIGASKEYRNVEVAQMVCEAFGVRFDDVVEFVPDRPFNDRRYAVVYDKIKDLGWAPHRHLDAELPTIADWYRANAHRYGA